MMVGICETRVISNLESWRVMTTHVRCHVDDVGAAVAW